MLVSGRVITSVEFSSYPRMVVRHNNQQIAVSHVSSPGKTFQNVTDAPRKFLQCFCPGNTKKLAPKIQVGNPQKKYMQHSVRMLLVWHFTVLIHSAYSHLLCILSVSNLNQTTAKQGASRHPRHVENPLSWL